MNLLQCPEANHNLGEFQIHRHLEYLKWYNVNAVILTIRAGGCFYMSVDAPSGLNALFSRKTLRSLLNGKSEFNYKEKITYEEYIIIVGNLCSIGKRSIK